MEMAAAGYVTTEEYEQGVDSMVSATIKATDEPQYINGLEASLFISVGFFYSESSSFVSSVFCRSWWHSCIF
jgi:hypothetical protein